MTERIETLVMTGQSHDRKIYVKKMTWDIPADYGLNLLAKNYFCGYVELKPGDYYYDHAADTEWDLPAPGGITYSTDCYGQLSELGPGKWIGFDTAHPEMDYTEQEAVKATKDLAELLDRLAGKRYEED